MRKNNISNIQSQLQQSHQLLHLNSNENLQLNLKEVQLQSNTSTNSNHLQYPLNRHLHRLFIQAVGTIPHLRLIFQICAKKVKYNCNKGTKINSTKENQQLIHHHRLEIPQDIGTSSVLTKSGSRSNLDVKMNLDMDKVIGIDVDYVDSNSDSFLKQVRVQTTCHGMHKNLANTEEDIKKGKDKNVYEKDNIDYQKRYWKEKSEEFVTFQTFFRFIEKHFLELPAESQRNILLVAIKESSTLYNHEDNISSIVHKSANNVQSNEESKIVDEISILQEKNISFPLPSSSFLQSFNIQRYHEVVKKVKKEESLVVHPSLSFEKFHHMLICLVKKWIQEVKIHDSWIIYLFHELENSYLQLKYQYQYQKKFSLSNKSPTWSTCLENSNMCTDSVTANIPSYILRKYLPQYFQVTTEERKTTDKIETSHIKSGKDKGNTSYCYEDDVCEEDNDYTMCKRKTRDNDFIQEQEGKTIAIESSISKGNSDQKIIQKETFDHSSSEEKFNKRLRVTLDDTKNIMSSDTIDNHKEKDKKYDKEKTSTNIALEHDIRTKLKHFKKILGPFLILPSSALNKRNNKTHSMHPTSSPLNIMKDLCLFLMKTLLVTRSATSPELDSTSSSNEPRQLNLNLNREKNMEKTLKHTNYFEYSCEKLQLYYLQEKYLSMLMKYMLMENPSKATVLRFVLNLFLPRFTTILLTMPVSRNVLTIIVEVAKIYPKEVVIGLLLPLILWRWDPSGSREKISGAITDQSRRKLENSLYSAISPCYYQSEFSIRLLRTGLFNEYMSLILEYLCLDKDFESEIYKFSPDLNSLFAILYKKYVHEWKKKSIPSLSFSQFRKEKESKEKNIVEERRVNNTEMIDTIETVWKKEWYEETFTFLPILISTLDPHDLSSRLLANLLDNIIDYLRRVPLLTEKPSIQTKVTGVLRSMINVFANFLSDEKGRWITLLLLVPEGSQMREILQYTVNKL